MVIVSGCIRENQQKKTTSTSVLVVTTPSTSTTTLPVMLNFGLKCYELRDEDKVECIRINALNKRNSSLCPENDFICMALIERNLTFCNNISDRYTKDLCRATLDVDHTECLPLGDSRKAICTSFRVFLSNNISLCDRLATELSDLFKYQCYDYLALLRMNTSICNDVSGNWRCYDSIYNLGIMLGDPSICDKVDDPDRCYEHVYTQLPATMITVDLCNKINNREIRNSCNRVSTYWKTKPGFDEQYCEQDSDCVPEKCCRPTRCVNVDRSGCLRNPCCLCSVCMDCIKSCECVNNRCKTNYIKVSEGACC